VWPTAHVNECSLPLGWSVGSLLAQGRGTEMSAAPLRCGLCESLLAIGNFVLSLSICYCITSIAGASLSVVNCPPPRLPPWPLHWSPILALLEPPVNVYIEHTEAVTYPAHLTQFRQHDDDGGIVFPQHAPEVFGGARQGTLSGDVCSPVPVTLSNSPNVGTYEANALSSNC